VVTHSLARYAGRGSCKNPKPRRILNQQKTTGHSNPSRRSFYIKSQIQRQGISTLKRHRSDHYRPFRRVAFNRALALSMRAMSMSNDPSDRFVESLGRGEKRLLPTFLYTVLVI